ncbi:MAG: hypothetical protein JKY52_16605 [Flavobacteriales bacterium]|nr:hypothetical protein [Flavobacteriales bacterium]
MTKILLGLTLFVMAQSALAQQRALVLANGVTKQFRHIKMNRRITIKLKRGNRYHSWLMKEINDSSIVMAHGHVILFEEISNLRRITEMHLVVRLVAPVFFVPFGMVLFAVGLKEGKDTPVPRQFATYAGTAIVGLAALTPLVISHKDYDFDTGWYLRSGSMPKKLLKRRINQPKGAN